MQQHSLIGTRGFPHCVAGTSGPRVRFLFSVWKLSESFSSWPLKVEILLREGGNNDGLMPRMIGLRLLCVLPAAIPPVSEFLLLISCFLYHSKCSPSVHGAVTACDEFQKLQIPVIWWATAGFGTTTDRHTLDRVRLRTAESFTERQDSQLENTQTIDPGLD